MQSVIVEIIKSLATLETAKKLAKVAAIGFSTTVGSILARRALKDDQPRRKPPPNNRRIP